MSIVNISHADYLKHPAYGASDIIKMGESFAYFKEKKANPDPAGRPLVVGSVTHTKLQAELTGAKSLLRGIEVYKDGSSGTRGFRTFQADRPHSYCIDEEEDALTARCVTALLNEPEVVGYLKDAAPEMTLLADYPGTKIACKVRPDYLHAQKGISINVKTAADASESGFLYGARDYAYDWQSAMYCAMLSARFGRPFDEIHIVVQKGDTAAECKVNIFSFGDDTIGFARQQIHELMQHIPECEKTGIWPSKKAHLHTLDVPVYMRRVFSL